jgi:hypothetical protein
LVILAVFICFGFCARCAHGMHAFCVRTHPPPSPGNDIGAEDLSAIQVLLDRNCQVFQCFSYLFCPLFSFHMFVNHFFQIAAETENYTVRFADGSTQRFGGFVKKSVTITQLANCVATGESRIVDGSVFPPYGHQPRLIFGGVLCVDSALCESFRVGSSSVVGGGGGAEAAAAGDLVFDVVCRLPCVWCRLRCVMHVTRRAS